MALPTVVITGAAAGIGRATARRFAEAGYFVAAYDVDVQGLASLAQELGHGAITAHLDVTDAFEWQVRLAEFGEATGGRLDVLVNNAGILRAGRFAEMPLAAQRAIFEVNALGVLNGCHAAYPMLKVTPKSVVVNVASASAIYGQPELAAYSASKFAVRGLTEALDLEWAEDDIAVRAVWPLFVDTGMLAGVETQSTRSLGVHLTAEDVADAVLAATQRTRRPRGVHRPVGLQAAAMFTAADMTPAWLSRQVNKVITSRGRGGH
jgi:NAD(P)-dependent dehydrogenase (short-subunit alcohol dehydrogenase family)